MNHEISSSDNTSNEANPWDILTEPEPAPEPTPEPEPMPTPEPELPPEPTPEPEPMPTPEPELPPKNPDASDDWGNTEQDTTALESTGWNDIFDPDAAEKYGGANGEYTAGDINSTSVEG